MRIVSILLLLCAASFAAAGGDEAVVYDRVGLAASVEREIANDLFVAELYVEQEGQRQAEIAGRVNEAMAWALEQAKAAPGVKAETFQYNTQPVYGSDSTRITGWRARQSLRLEGREAKTIGELVAALQERLAVEAVRQTVSREARGAAEDELTATALEQFDARAQRVAATLGRPGYRLVHIDVSSVGNPGVPIAYRSPMLAAASPKAAPVQIEAGEQTLGIVVSGTIQLDPVR